LQYVTNMHTPYLMWKCEMEMIFERNLVLMRNSDEKFLFYQQGPNLLIRLDAAEIFVVEVTHDMTYRNTALVWDIILC
jgi:hypothetical protein